MTRLEGGSARNKYAAQIICCVFTAAPQHHHQMLRGPWAVT